MKIFKNEDMTEFTRQKALLSRLSDDLRNKANQFLKEYEYWPTEDELPYYPDMYEAAIERVQQIGDHSLPSEKVAALKDAYQMVQTSRAYCDLTFKDEDKFELEPLSAEA